MTDDWILPPGTIKRQCNSCPLEFASRNGALTCAYCITNRAAGGKRGSISSSVSPFDPVVGGSGSGPARQAGGLRILKGGP